MFPGKCESRFFCAPKKVQATTRLEIKRAHFDESLALFAKKPLSVSFEREKIPLLERFARLQIPISPLEELFGGKKKWQNDAREKRTRSSPRELHLITTQVRIRFVHGIRFLFRFSFAHLGCTDVCSPKCKCALSEVFRLFEPREKERDEPMSRV